MDEYEKDVTKQGMKLEKPKNYGIASIQITAEQIVRDSEAQKTDEIIIPTQRINDEEELNDYKLRRRHDFEESVKRHRHRHAVWLNYALFEESLGEYPRLFFKKSAINLRALP